MNRVCSILAIMVLAHSYLGMLFVTDQHARSVESEPNLPKYKNEMAQLRFLFPEGSRISFGIYNRENGKRKARKLDAPARFNFALGEAYHFRVTGKNELAKLKLKMTIYIAKESDKTRELIAHTAIPISFSEKETNRLKKGGSIAKAYYFFGKADNGDYIRFESNSDDHRISDPVAEACRKGELLLILHAKGNRRPNYAN